MRQEARPVTRTTPRFLLACALALLPLAAAFPSAAQSLFASVAKVNEAVVTEWQVQQRARFLDLFRTPGNTRLIAIDRLIEEQLQVQAGAAAGIVPTPEAVQAGMTEFASRVELSLEEFIAAIGQGGVSAEAYRDFVAAGIVWRELVRDRFGPEARPEDGAVDARLLETGAEGGTRVLLSEIILPADDPATAAASRARAAELSRIADADEFAAAARLFSQAPTRFQGGTLEWRPLAALPDIVRPTVAATATGQASRPVELGTSIALFFMRDREEVRAAPPGDIAIDYALLTLPAPEAAARVAATVQTCDDLYTDARGLPEDALRRETAPEAQIPAAVRQALAGLDRHETAILPGTVSTVVMLCARQPNTEAALNRLAVTEELAQRTLGARANRLLAELRAQATIVRFE
jgi:peptidyl-prolyl cis-trans isomerase SurA